MSKPMYNKESIKAGGFQVFPQFQHIAVDKDGDAYGVRQSPYLRC